MHLTVMIEKAYGLHLTLFVMLWILLLLWGQRIWDPDSSDTKSKAHVEE